jgi:hypothetical protein
VYALPNTLTHTHTHTHPHTQTQVHTALKDIHRDTLEDTHSVVVGGVTYHMQVCVCVCVLA